MGSPPLGGGGNCSAGGNVGGTAGGVTVVGVAVVVGCVVGVAVVGVMVVGVAVVGAVVEVVVVLVVVELVDTVVVVPATNVVGVESSASAAFGSFTSSSLAADGAACDRATGQFEIDDKRSVHEIAQLLKTQGFDAVWKDWDPAILATS